MYDFETMPMWRKALKIALAMPAMFPKFTLGCVLLALVAAATFAFVPKCDESCQASARINAYDSEKLVELRKASQASIDSARLKGVAESLDAQSKKALDESARAKAWSKSCRDANVLGEDSPAVSCDVIQAPEPANATGSAITDTGASAPVVFINPGHGLSDNGKWADKGAILPDGTTERSTVKEFSIAVTDALKREYPYVRTVPVGFEPHSTQGNIKWANQEARKRSCVFATCVLISIHANFSADPSISGSIVYYNEAVPGAKEIAASLAKAANPSNWRTLPDQTNRHGRLGVVRDVENVNSFLLEVGYMTNPQDFRAMYDKGSEEFKHATLRIASAIANL